MRYVCVQYAYIVEGKFYAGILLSRGNNIKIHAAAFLFKNVINNEPTCIHVHVLNVPYNNY